MHAYNVDILGSRFPAFNMIKINLLNYVNDWSSW